MWSYRACLKGNDLERFSVSLGETNLLILSDKFLEKEAKREVLRLRSQLIDYISAHTIFKKTYRPYKVTGEVPEIIKKMSDSSIKAGVGPMAAVAGAIAEFLGRELLKYSQEVIVENGGDIFIRCIKPRKVGIYAGMSSLSERLALKIEPENTPLGICTSSGVFGHSESFGKADSVTCISRSAALADAACTAICNIIQDRSDIEKGLKLGKHIEGISGVVIIKDNELGIWGDINLVVVSKNGEIK
ncbi:MAG: UPF0280 family protein [bacterium]|nr:UPF0280 family protein [bacterium]